MIRYDLLCDKDHAFDSWFADSDAFEKQAKRGFVTCPHCQSAKVRKAIMAPSVSGTRKKHLDAASQPAADEATSAVHAPVANMAATVPVISEKDREMRAMLRAVHEHVSKNSDDVGDRFAHEARKMHYGETEMRAIRGKASMDDARALHEEGIDFQPLPSLPDDWN